MSGIANASHPPPLGPHIDADPGTPDGKNWVYIYSLLLLLLAFEMLLLQILNPVMEALMGPHYMSCMTNVVFRFNDQNDQWSWLMRCFVSMITDQNDHCMTQMIIEWSVIREGLLVGDRVSKLFSYGVLIIALWKAFSYA